MKATALRPARCREEGFTHLLFLALLLVASIFTVSMVSRMEILLRERVRARASFSALYAAQGGVESALAALARDPGWKGGEATVGRARAEVRVEGVAAGADLREVTVVATDPGANTEATRARKVVKVSLRLREGVLPEVLSWREGPLP